MIRPRLEITFPMSCRRRFFFGDRMYVPSSGEFLMNRARSGIALAIKALGLGTGHRVGMMCYNCRSVMASIAGCGCDVVFIDITEDLTIDLEDLRRKSEGMSALVVTHLFGIVNDLSAIRGIVHSIPIIEDCAHSSGSGGCGSEGDFAVYSLGMGKLPSIGDGGILKVNNPEFLDKVDSLYRGIESYSLADEVKLFLKISLKTLSYKPLFYNITRLLKHNVSDRRYSSVPCLKMSNGIRRLMCLYDLQEAVSFRRRNVVKIVGMLPEGSRPLDSHLTNCFMLPVLCDNPSDIINQFLSIGVESAVHFSHCIDWAAEFGYDEGNCPQTEYMKCHLVALPTYFEY